uniref:Dehydrogenase/reductase SDR family member 13 n=1 Tax=Naja naja TaxID=35670 RepID=A0A8C6VAA9_NAJNA
MKAWLLDLHRWLGDLHESFLCPFLGGNSGIGKATAVDLAQRGTRVILACRYKERGESAVHDVRQESGNSEVILMILDLTFLASEPRLDILINNAGGGTSFQVNHLSHFLLTHLLLDRLKRCAPSRIVIVASNFHFFGNIDFHTIHKPVKGLWKSLKSYCNSKLANILHVGELAKWLEGTNITCYAVHPGMGLFPISSSSFLLLSAFSIPPILSFALLFLRDWKTGAQTIIYCATEEGIERLSGQYFVDCQPKVPWPQACDDQMAMNLWEFSEMLLGLTTSDRKGRPWKRPRSSWPPRQPWACPRSSRSRLGTVVTHQI